jgi:multiple antibiotic resistance protein
LSLTFASPGLSSLNEGEQREAQGRGDIAVFPMAFPLIAGPGTLSAIVLLMGRAQDWRESAGICAVLILCLAITFVAMRISDRLMRFLGRTGSDVVGRISGVLLAALAVQFVFDGLRQAGIIAPV